MGSSARSVLARREHAHAPRAHLQLLVRDLLLQVLDRREPLAELGRRDEDGVELVGRRGRKVVLVREAALEADGLALDDGGVAPVHEERAVLARREDPRAVARDPHARDRAAVRGLRRRVRLRDVERQLERLERAVAARDDEDLRVVDAVGRREQQLRDLRLVGAGDDQLDVFGHLPALQLAQAAVVRADDDARARARLGHAGRGGGRGHCRR
jgi:hypothetical protein